MFYPALNLRSVPSLHAGLLKHGPCAWMTRDSDCMAQVRRKALTVPAGFDPNPSLVFGRSFRVGSEGQGAEARIGEACSEG